MVSMRTPEPEWRGQAAMGYDETYAESPSASRSYDPREIDPVVVEDILNHSEEIAVAEDGRGGEVTLLRLLKAYEAVLSEHGISPEEDTNYYRFLLKLSLDPDPDWWVKYEREKSRATRSGGLGGRSPLRAAVPAALRGASVGKSALKRGPSPHAPRWNQGARAYDSQDDSRDVASDSRRVRGWATDSRARDSRRSGSRTPLRFRSSHGGTSRRRGWHLEDEEDDPAESGYADFKLTAAAFRVWIRHAASLRALRKAREAAVENWMIAVSFWECNALRRSFARWRARGDVMRLRALRFRSVETARRRFGDWKRRAYELRTAREAETVRVTRALAMWSRRNASRCFETWRFVAEETNERRVDVLAASGARRLAGVVRAWFSETARRRALERVRVVLESRTANRLKRAVCVEWGFVFQERARLRALVARARKRVRDRSVSGAFLGWRLTVAEALETEASLERVAARFRDRNRSVWFRGWLEIVSNAVVAREKIKTMTARVLRGGGRRAARAWRDYASERARLESLRQKVAFRIAARVAGSVCAGWREFTETKGRHRELCFRIASRVRHRTKLETFSGWRRRVEALRREAECFERVKRLPERRLARFGWTTWRDAYQLRLKMHHATQMLLRASSARALRAWHARVDVIKAKKNAAMKASRFSRTRTVSGAFERWREFVAERIEQREKMHRVIVHMTVRVVSGAFERWREFVAERIEQREKMHRVIVHMTVRVVSGAFERWREFVVETKRARFVELRVSAALTERYASPAFSAWMAETKEGSERLAAAKRGIRRVKRDAAWRRWRETVAAAAAREAQIRGARDFFARRTKRFGFHAWRLTARRMAETRVIVARFVTRVSKNEMSRAWEKWVTFAEDRADARFAAERAVRWWMQKELMSTFERWLVFLERARRSRRASHFFQARLAARMFTRWLEFCETREALRRAVAYFTNGTLLRAVQTWSERVLEAGEAKILAQKASRFRIATTLRGSFARWAAFVEEAVETREKNARAAARFAWKTSRDVFFRWRASARYEIVSALNLRRALETFHRRARFAALTCWRETVSERKATRAKANQILVRVSFRRLGGAFDRWFAFITEKRVSRRASRRAVGYFSRIASRTAYRGWVAAAARRRSTRARSTRALVLCAMHIEGRSFRRWRRGAASFSKERANQVVKTHATRRLASCARVWFKETLISKKLRAKRAVVLLRRAFWTGRRAFRVWTVTTRGVRHWRLRRSREAFATWTGYVHAAKEVQIREAMFAFVVRRIVFGTVARVFLGWRSILSRNARFFRKRRVLRVVVAAAAKTVRRNRRVAVATAWRAWRLQTVDPEKVRRVRVLLRERLVQTKGACVSGWRTYAARRRAKTNASRTANASRSRFLKRVGFREWREAARAAERETRLKASRASAFAFRKRLCVSVTRWRVSVAAAARKTRAVRRVVRALAEFWVLNFGREALRAWLRLVRERRRSATRARGAETYRRFKVTESAFLSWKVFSTPVSAADHPTAFGSFASDVWDDDFDDRGDPVEVRARVLVRRARAMFEGRNPDEEEDVSEDEASTRFPAPRVANSKRLSSSVETRTSPAKGTTLNPASARTTRVSDFDSDFDSGFESDARRAPFGARVGGAPSSRPPASSAAGVGFCGECGAKYAVKKKFCVACGEHL